MLLPRLLLMRKIWQAIRLMGVQLGILLSALGLLLGVTLEMKEQRCALGVWLGLKEQRCTLGVLLLGVLWHALCIWLGRKEQQRALGVLLFGVLRHALRVLLLGV